MICDDRQISIEEEPSLGIGRRIMDHGDVVAVLPGYPSPVVSKPEECQGHYILRKAAHVLGVIDREVVRERPQKAVELGVA